MSDAADLEIFGQLRPWIRRRIEGSQSIRRMASRILARGGSSWTVANYIRDVSAFCKWLQLTPDQAIASKFDFPALLNEYLDHIYTEKRLAPSAGSGTLVALKKWLAVNDVLAMHDPAWEKVEVGRSDRVEVEELPNKETLRKILASGDLAEKTFALIAISSGLRIGSILRLRLKDIDLEREIPLVSPPPETTKNRRRFHTFISPEAKETLLQYLKDRELRARKLRQGRNLPPSVEERLKVGPESFVIVAERPLGAPIRDIASGDRRWMNMVSRAGFNRKVRTRNTLHFHVLRKFFKTWATVSGVPSDLVEYFMGHRSGLTQTYFLPEGVERPPEDILKRLEEEYRKALPALTVMSDAEQVKRLEETIEKEREKLQAELDKEREEFEAEKLSWASRIEALTQQVNTLEKAIDQIISRRSSAGH
jgi:integrase